MLDPVRQTLSRRDGSKLEVSPKAIEVLLALIEHQGEVVSKEDLLRCVWQGTAVEENNLTRQISTLRKALGEEAGSRRYIATIPGKGYKFVCPLESVSPPQAEPSPTHLAWKPLAGILAVCAIGTAAAFISQRDQSQALPFQSVSLALASSDGTTTRVAISDDGRYLARATGPEGGQTLLVRRIASGMEAAVKISAALIFKSLSFDPAGEYVYCQAKVRGTEIVNLYRSPVAGGELKLVLADVESPPGFAPAGDRFAIVRTDRERSQTALWIIKIDGSIERKLAVRKLPEYLDYPNWSPDGEQILCTDIGPALGNHVVAINVNSGGERHIGSWGFLRSPRWLPNGKSFLLDARAKTAPNFQIWQVSFPDGVARRISNDLDDYYGLSTTSDGRTVVSVQRKAASGLWVGDGETMRQIGVSGGYYDELSWIGSERVLYGLHNGGEAQIWSVTTDGQQRKQLTADGSNNCAQVCGKQMIVFSSDRLGPTSPYHSASTVWRMDMNGDHQQQISTRVPVGSSSCSPDGKWVVTALHDNQFETTLWRMGADGSGAVQLSGDRSVQPRVSPDGQRVAWLFSSSGPQKEVDALGIMRLSGGAPSRTFPLMHRIAPGETNLQWLPDGSAVAYVKEMNGVSNIYARDINTGSDRQLTHFTEDQILNFAWSNDWSKLAVVRSSLAQDVVTLTDTGTR